MLRSIRPQMQASASTDVALVASGTATLEAALARCPHVIYYRLTALTHEPL